MAEERSVGMHPGKALAEVCEKGHARHDIRSEIQKVEAVGVHDVIEEIGERGAEPAGKVINEEGVPIRPASVKPAGMMRVAGCPFVLHPHRGLK